MKLPKQTTNVPYAPALCTCTEDAHALLESDANMVRYKHGALPDAEAMDLEWYKHGAEHVSHILTGLMVNRVKIDVLSIDRQLCKD